MIKLHVKSNLVDGFIVVKDATEASQLKQTWAETAKYGKPAWTETVIDEPERKEIVVIQPEIKDAEGNVTQPEITEERTIPATFKTIEHAAEYSITEEDMSAEIAAKAAEAKAKEDLKKEVEGLLNKPVMTTQELTKAVKYLLAK